MTEAPSAAWISPPGGTIEDLLEERSWSKQELAARLGCTPKHVSQLLSGEAPIHPQLAETLSRVLGSTAEFWLKREADYRAALQRRADADALSADADWLDEIPVPWLVSEGHIRKYRHPGEQIDACLRFFGTGSVAAWRQTYAAPGVAWRASQTFGKKQGAVAAWLRCAELQAEQIPTAPWSESGFRAALPLLRALTNEPRPDVFVQELTARCAEQGVAVVFVPTPQGCPASGCTRWLTPDRALLVLSLRYKRNDHLWFTFFHEAGHLLLHSKKQAFIEGLDGLDEDLEAEADRFAADQLIPRGAARELASLKSETAIRAFAKKAGIHPGIVVGRLQHEKILAQGALDRLKVKYDWRREDRADG